MYLVSEKKLQSYCLLKEKYASFLYNLNFSKYAVNLMRCYLF